MQIGILGGTGPAGSGLAARLASVGFETIIGSRSKYRALEVRDGLVEKWADLHLPLLAGDNHDAANADVVVVATPWDAAASTAKEVAEELRGKVVISMANAIAKVGHEFQPLVPPRGSVAASVQAAVPQAMVAGALHHVPAKELGDLRHPCVSDVLVCSDHPEATAVTIEIVSKLPGMRPLDSGELSNAAPIEAFVSVMLQLNVKYKTRVALQLTGLEKHFASLEAAKAPAAPEAPAEAAGDESAKADPPAKGK
ncbi:MAG: NADPH-dependent F420 reductase [Actinobacteria bacterium]|nr:NADPH-dependent F420 reductase [Actinomycetota bacterium]